MTSNQESINQFLRKGELQTAPFGMDKSDLLAQFGKSEDFLTVSRKDQRISLLKYGETEFYFGESHNYEKLTGVLFQPITSASLSLGFQLDSQWLQAKMTHFQICKLLNQEEIEFEEKEDNMGQHIIETASGVVFYFFDDEYEELTDWQLNKFGRFVP